MVYKFTIPGKLPGLNEYTAANRRNAYVGARMKKDTQRYITACIKRDLKNVKITKPILMHYDFYEENRRRDHDNVESFAHKCVQDALVRCGVLKDDGWNEIAGDTNSFYVDKANPRIEITMTELTMTEVE